MTQRSGNHQSGRLLSICTAMAAFAEPGWAYAMQPPSRDAAPRGSSLIDASYEADQDQNAGAASVPSASTIEDTGAALKEIRSELAAQRKLIEEQSKVIEQQRAEIAVLHTQVDTDQALSEQRGGTAAPAMLSAVAIAQGAAPPPSQTVGEAPSEAQDVAPKVSALPEGQGVLTAPGDTVLESSFEYTRSSNNRLVFRGVELIPGLQLGLIEASDVDSDTFVGTLAVRHGVTNRLEIEARMPVLARLDRIRITQLRDQGIVREVNLDAYELGDAEIALRYQLNRASGPEQPIYVANLRLKSTTGKSPFSIEYDEFGVARGLATGSGFWGLQAGGSFLLPSDPAVIYGGLSYLWHIPRRINKTIGGALIGRVDPGDAISANVGFGFALNPRFSFSLGYNHSYIFPTKTEIGGTNQKSKGLQVGSLSVGTSYRLSARQSVNFGFEFGMTSDAPDMSVTLRLPLRF
jgi:hypothetical protein